MEYVVILKVLKKNGEQLEIECNYDLVNTRNGVLYVSQELKGGIIIPLADIEEISWHHKDGEGMEYSRKRLLIHET